MSQFLDRYAHQEGTCPHPATPGRRSTFVDLCDAGWAVVDTGQRVCGVER